MSLVSIADRTGSAQGWLAESGDPSLVIEVAKPTEIGLAGPEGDVLVLGPKEVSAAGLRRVATWKATRSGAVVVLTDDVAGLRTADVMGVVDTIIDTSDGDAHTALVTEVVRLVNIPPPVVMPTPAEIDSAMARLRRGRSAAPVVRPVTLRSRPGQHEQAFEEQIFDEEEGFEDEATLDGEYDETELADASYDEGELADASYDDDELVDGELVGDEAELEEEFDDEAELEPDDDFVPDEVQASDVGADEVGGDVLDGVVVTPPAEEPAKEGRRRFGRPGPKPSPTALVTTAPVVPVVAEPAGETAATPSEELVETPAAAEAVEPAAPGTPEEPAAPAGPAGPGQVITVAAASGGCGKTLYSTNLAAFLASKGLRVLLIDLDLQFGEVAMALRLRHPYSIYDGLYDPQANPLPDTAFTEHVSELVVRSELDFDVLCAPRDPRFAEAITSEDAAFVIEVTRLLYDVVVIDTPPSLAPVALAALDRSSSIAVLVTLDVPSLRNLASYLDVLSDRAVDESLVKLLVNKVEPDIGLDVKGAQEAFGGKFKAELPADRSASRSVNKGVVVVRAEPKSSLAKAIMASFHAVLPPGLQHLAAPPKKSGFFSRFSSK